MVAALFYWHSERALYVLNREGDGGEKDMYSGNEPTKCYCIFVGNSCGSDADKRVPIVFMNSNGMSAN